MNASLLREKSVEELRKELLDSHREIFNLRMQRGSGQMTGHHRFKVARRTIARIRTILSERERA